MNILKIVMGVIFGISAAYIIWCLCGATRYIRKHSDEFNMKLSEDKQSDIGEKK